MSLFTVLGATGFIGRHLVSYLRGEGHDVLTPARDVAHLRGNPLGHVIYCIGTTGNFRQYPQAAVDAHVNRLYALIEGANFESWLYLSSTRIYSGLPEGQSAQEEMDVPLLSSPNSIFDLTKMLGESVCMDLAKGKARIVRLSNVYGYDQSPQTFLGSVLDSLCASRRTVFQDAPDSAKDYISIKDVIPRLAQISLGEGGIYNLARGENLTHGQIAEVLEAQGYKVDFNPEGKRRVFPPISVEKVSARLGVPSSCLLVDIGTLLEERRVFLSRGEKV